MLDTSTEHSVQALLERQALLLHEQRATGTIGRRLAAKEIAVIFQRTPLLTSFRCTFDFEWATVDGRPSRKVTAFPLMKFAQTPLGSPVVTQYGGVVWADDPDDALDMELQFTQHLEKQALDKIGRLLDIGKDEIIVEITRNKVNSFRQPGSVDLARMAEAMVAA
jgi:hypothetical protein